MPEHDAKGEGKGKRGTPPGKAPNWDSQSASEAAKKRWAKQREREAEAVEAPAITIEEQIRAKLQAKALGGDVAAARELREWLALRGPEHSIDIFALLDRGQREQVRAWLEAHRAKLPA